MGAEPAIGNRVRMNQTTAPSHRPLARPDNASSTCNRRPENVHWSGQANARSTSSMEFNRSLRRGPTEINAPRRTTFRINTSISPSLERSFDWYATGCGGVCPTGMLAGSPPIRTPLLPTGHGPRPPRCQPHPGFRAVDAQVVQHPDPRASGSATVCSIRQRSPLPSGFASDQLRRSSRRFLLCPDGFGSSDRVSHPWIAAPGSGRPRLVAPTGSDSPHPSDPATIASCGTRAAFARLITERGGAYTSTHHCSRSAATPRTRGEDITTGRPSALQTLIVPLHSVDMAVEVGLGWMGKECWGGESNHASPQEERGTEVKRRSSDDIGRRDWDMAVLLCSLGILPGESMEARLGFDDDARSHWLGTLRPLADVSRR